MPPSTRWRRTAYAPRRPHPGRLSLPPVLGHDVPPLPISSAARAAGASCRRANRLTLRGAAQFVIIPSYFDGELREEMAAAMRCAPTLLDRPLSEPPLARLCRRVLPPWDELKQDLPEGFDGTMP